MSEIKVGNSYYRKVIYEIGLANKLPMLELLEVEKVTPKMVKFKTIAKPVKIELLKESGFMLHTKELEKECVRLTKVVELFRFFYFGKWQNNTACTIISSGKQNLIDKVQEMKDFIEREFKEYL